MFLLLEAAALGLLACSGSTDDPDTSTSDGPVGGTGGGGGGSGGVGGAGGTTPPTGPDPATVPLGGTCPLDVKLGEFKVESYDEYSIVDGQVLDGVTPVAVLEEIGREGECVLLRRNNAFCDPLCAPDETCDFGTCIPAPLGQDLGSVTVTGLLDPVEMTPVFPGAKYFVLTLPHPPHVPGDLITLTTEGVALEPLEMYGVAVEPLVWPEGDLLIQAETDLPLTWPAPVGPSRSTIWFRMNVDQHGITPVQLICESADDGEFTIPASLIDALLAQGVTGFPSVLVHRRTMDARDVTGGCVEFRIAWTAQPKLRVEGFTPCVSDFDCTPPLTCDEEIGLCI
jgi:hypothetical protein